MVLKHFLKSRDHTIKHLDKKMATCIRLRKPHMHPFLQNKERIHVLKAKNAASKEASYAMTIRIPQNYALMKNFAKNVKENLKH